MKSINVYIAFDPATLIILGTFPTFIITHVQNDIYQRSITAALVATAQD